MKTAPGPAIVLFITALIFGLFAAYVVAAERPSCPLWSSCQEPGGDKGAGDRGRGGGAGGDPGGSDGPNGGGDAPDNGGNDTGRDQRDSCE